MQSQELIRILTFKMKIRIRQPNQSMHWAWKELKSPDSRIKISETLKQHASEYYGCIIMLHNVPMIKVNSKIENVIDKMINKHIDAVGIFNVTMLKKMKVSCYKITQYNWLTRFS